MNISKTLIRNKSMQYTDKHICNLSCEYRRDDKWRTILYQSIQDRENRNYSDEKDENEQKTWDLGVVGVKPTILTEVRGQRLEIGYERMESVSGMTIASAVVGEVFRHQRGNDVVSLPRRRHRTVAHGARVAELRHRSLRTVRQLLSLSLCYFTVPYLHSPSDFRSKLHCSVDRE